MATGAELFVACLKAGGIDTVYGIPGEETTHLMQAIEDQGLDFVLCRHEQAAAFMAAVHGRLTGRPAVCLATLGPGATNLVTGVADATLDYAPLVAVTGQGARDRIGRESHQMLDLTALFRPVTKLSRTILRADAIAPAVAEALRVAVAPRPGAVHLCLPEDIAGEPADGTPFAPGPRHSPVASDAALKEVAAVMRDARIPILLCGGGVVRGRAADALRDLAEATDLPVATSFMAKGLLPVGHAQALEAFGHPEETAVDRAIRAADLIVAIGLDPIEYPPAKLTRCGDIPTVSLAEVAMPRDAGWHLTGEAVGALPDALQRLRAFLDGARGWRRGEEARAARLSATEPGECAAEDTATPAPILAAINAQLEPDDILLSGVGNHKMWIARELHPLRAGQLVIPNGLAGMGLAAPGAIAAARLFPDSHVLAICGDGDVLMNVQDFETASRLDLHLTVMVWQDGGYGLIEKKHAADTGRQTELGFGKIGWDDLAAGFGWTHHPCHGVAGLGDTLARVRADRGRHLVTLPVRYPDV